MFNKTKIKIDGYNVSKIESEDGFTMHLEDMSGGPIISAADEKTCESKFKRALMLMEGLTKLRSFKETGRLTNYVNYKND